MSTLVERDLGLLAASFAGALGVAYLVGRWPGLRRISGCLDHGLALPAIAALVTALVTMGAWGYGLQPLPRVHDESAYLLQAEIFASGRWTAPAAPTPEFFEQPHVQAVPSRAAKYPPGHALLLTPGVWMGWPALGPLVLASAAALLIVLLARRLAGGGVALLTWGLWLTSDLGMRWRPTYFSQLTSGLCILLAWWALWHWVESGKSRWLLVVSASLGWMAITRPLTAVALGLPIIVVALIRTWRKGLWGDLVAPALLSVAILSLLPLWAFRVTGSWTDLPVTRYTADYLPFDRLGFGLDTTPPRRQLPHSYKGLVTGFSELHEAHTRENLPEIARVRVERLRHAAWSGWRRWLAPAFLIGLLVVPGPGLVAVGSIFAHLGIMLSYAHPWSWTLYYSELAPLVAFFTAAGVGGAAGVLRRRIGSDTGKGGSTPWAVGAAIALLPLLGLGMNTDVRRARVIRDHQLKRVIAFHEAIRAVPGPTIIFVRYPAKHAGYDVLVANPADLAAARNWVVHDLGGRNGELAALAPERNAYVWNERSGTLQPWEDDGPPASLSP